MKTDTSNSITWNELVFSNRNKAYGAFLLRKLYNDHLSFAFTITTLLVLLSMGGTRLLMTLNVKPNAFVPEFKNDGLIPEPIIKRILEAKQVVTQQKASRKDVFVATTKTVVVEPIAKTDQPQATTGTQEIDVQSNGSSTIPSLTTTSAAIPVIEVPKIHNTAEVMPAYEGGVEAMIKFLSKKIKFPASARRNDVEGTVYVQFVINTAGMVTDAHVIKGISPDCDAEAIRVVELMNKWKAGLQHGVPVSVRMVLPIKFTIS